ncbi:MAG: FMNH2-dependent dimethyl sulfone monooxygenase [Hyphomicrobiales bacterium]|nr:FMNH2-dependent dimethyl sulfone monooxygenase [Hyphomicrobiales bacterium]
MSEGGTPASHEARLKPLRLGVWTPLPHTIPPEPRMDAAIAALARPGGAGQPDASFEFACEVAARAERAGFSITLIAERYMGPDLEALMLAAALAGRTQMELLVAVHPGVIPPQIVAKMIASLDRLSGGRAALNIVNGWWADEFALYSNGAPLDADGARYQRMREYIEVVQAMLSGEEVDYSGRFFNAHAGRLPLRPVRDHIPFYAASRTPEGQETVARLCDLWFADYAPDHHSYDANLARMRGDIAMLQAKARGYGRDLDAGVSCHVICAPDDAQAQARADALLEYGKTNRIAAVAAKALGAGLVGSPERIAERIRAYHGIGVSCLMLHFHPMMEGLDTFIAEVTPLIADILETPSATREALS